MRPRRNSLRGSCSCTFMRSSAFRLWEGTDSVCRRVPWWMRYLTAERIAGLVSNHFIMIWNSPRDSLRVSWFEGHCSTWIEVSLWQRQQGHLSEGQKPILCMYRPKASWFTDTLQTNRCICPLICFHAAWIYGSSMMSNCVIENRGARTIRPCRMRGLVHSCTTNWRWIACTRKCFRLDMILLRCIQTAHSPELMIWSRGASDLVWCR